jgi:ATP-dependent helicase/nuclease subunit A
LVDTGGLIVVAGHRDILVPIGEGRDDPAFLWRRRADDATEQQRAADRASDAEAEREYLRLLYVAMTRARDVFYVAGIKAERTPPECWYSVVEKALVPADVERDRESGELLAPYVWPQPGRSRLAPAHAKPEPAAALPLAPPWLGAPASSPPRAPEPLRPSRALGEPDPRTAFGVSARAPAEPLRDLALRRGQAVHRLLQVLPGTTGSEREARARRIVAEEVGEDMEFAGDVTAEARSVLALPALQGLLGPSGRAEVAIAGTVATETGEFAVSGRIDRLVRIEAGWHIVDFKTDRAPPASLDAVDPAYVLQLALYRKLLSEIEPGMAIAASLVWTAGPNVMPIPVAEMERALAELGIRDTAVP